MRERVHAGDLMATAKGPKPLPYVGAIVLAEVCKATRPAIVSGIEGEKCAVTVFLARGTGRLRSVQAVECCDLVWSATGGAWTWRWPLEGAKS